MGRNELVDLTLIQEHETDTGYLVKETEDAKPVWIDKDKTERSECLDKRRQVYEYTLPEWHALKKGLI